MNETKKVTVEIVRPEEAYPLKGKEDIKTKEEYLADIRLALKIIKFNNTLIYNPFRQ